MTALLSPVPNAKTLPSVAVFTRLFAGTTSVAQSREICCAESEAARRAVKASVEVLSMTLVWTGEAIRVPLMHDGTRTLTFPGPTTFAA